MDNSCSALAMPGHRRSRRGTRLFTDGNGATTGYVETELPQEGTFVWIDSQNCIRCGACYRICPVDAIGVERAEIRMVSCNHPRSDNR